jgi:iron(III) transport system ATP-binding protein
MADIRIDGLVKDFAGVQALADISLDIPDGEVVALLGPSGCGKTTMLRCIAGLEEPSSGTIEVGGKTLFGDGVFVPPAQRNIAMVFQSYALWPHMTVTENIAFGLKIMKMPKAEIAERVAEVLGLLGLRRFATRFPAQLSGGQQQRVAVARALALRADVVLFDEPLSNLDLRLREEVRHELRRVLNELRLTAVYVTHDVSEAVVVADRIAMMSAGRIVQLGSPREIYHSPRSNYVAQFVGNVNTLTATVHRNGRGTRLVVENAFDFDAAKAVGAVPDGADTVQLMIRPEYVEVTSEVKDRSAAGAVADLEFIGQVTAMNVAIGAMKLRSVALSRPSARLAPGGRCGVTIADEDVVIIPGA